LSELIYFEPLLYHSLLHYRHYLYLLIIYCSLLSQDSYSCHLRYNYILYIIKFCTAESRVQNIFSFLDDAVDRRKLEPINQYSSLRPYWNHYKIIRCYLRTVGNVYSSQVVMLYCNLYLSLSKLIIFITDVHLLAAEREKNRVRMFLASKYYSQLPVVL